MPGFLQEIKRRNVFKVAVVYLIAGWVTMQIVDVMFPALNLPEWLTSAVAAFLLLGFPFALIFAWAFEVTPDGIKREKDVDRDESITPQTGQKLNRTAFIILGIAVGFLLLDKFFFEKSAEHAVPVAVTTEAKPSIAVLPFVNMSDDIANEYFSDGLSEELLNLLAKIPRLHVAGRTSSFKFKGTNEDLRIIGEQLNVAHVLEGSVRKSGTRLRITAQLIDTENGYHLWSETYDRDLTDIFAIQDEISANVVSALKIRLLGDEPIVANRGTDSTEAYNLFLQGMYFLQHTSAENLDKARAQFEQAIELDPEFSRAYVGLTEAIQQQVTGWTGSRLGEFAEGYKLLRKYADMAVAVDPTNSGAYVAQVIVASTVDWDLKKSREFGEKALELDPGNAVTMGWLASVYFLQDTPDDAVLMLQRNLQIDPLDISALRLLGDVYATSGNSKLGIETYRKALDLSPESWRLHGRIARAFIYQGNLDAARDAASQEPVDWVREMLEVIILGRSGKADEWRAAAIAYEEKYGLGNSYQLAEIYAAAGDLDSTFQWLATTVRVRDPGAIAGLIVPFFDEAKADPRWADFEAAFTL